MDLLSYLGTEKLTAMRAEGARWAKKIHAPVHIVECLNPMGAYHRVYLRPSCDVWDDERPLEAIQP